jgi:hypothetical protein
VLSPSRQRKRATKPLTVRAFLAVAARLARELRLVTPRARLGVAHGLAEAAEQPFRFRWAMNWRPFNQSSVGMCICLRARALECYVRIAGAPAVTRSLPVPSAVAAFLPVRKDYNRHRSVQTFCSNRPSRDLVNSPIVLRPRPQKLVRCYDMALRLDPSGCGRVSSLLLHQCCVLACV